MKVDPESLFQCTSLVRYKSEREMVEVNNYDTLLQKLEDEFGKREIYDMFFVFSALQGDVWREGQIRYYMQSSEAGSHNTPHVHVNIAHTASASISIIDGTILAGKIPQKYKSEITQKVRRNREYLIQCWNTMTDGINVDINYGMGITTFK